MINKHSIEAHRLRILNNRNSIVNDPKISNHVTKIEEIVHIKKERNRGTKGVHHVVIFFSALTMIGIVKQQ